MRHGEADRPAALPAQFDASQFTVDQRFATSKDGTRVPYFLVRKKGVTADRRGADPCLWRLPHRPDADLPHRPALSLGSRSACSGPRTAAPSSSPTSAAAANMAPAGGAMALREKRQNSFDDLEAVAPRPAQDRGRQEEGIAISGRSNGGVLTGAAITQHPDLYGAAIIGSPLFDMKRYSHLLAGASWIDEYGDPDKPADWAFMSKYSPYQNVKPGVRYPATFFYLSTKDDRVHPGMPARRRPSSSNLATTRSITMNIWKAGIRSAPTAARTRCARPCCGHS